MIRRKYDIDLHLLILPNISQLDQHGVSDEQTPFQGLQSNLIRYVPRYRRSYYYNWKFHRKRFYFQAFPFVRILQDVPEHVLPRAFGVKLLDFRFEGIVDDLVRFQFLVLLQECLFGFDDQFFRDFWNVCLLDALSNRKDALFCVDK